MRGGRSAGKLRGGADALRERGDTVAVRNYVKGSSMAIDRESGTKDHLDGKPGIFDTLYINADAETARSEAAR